MRKSTAMKIASKRRKYKPLPPAPEPTPEEAQTNAWLDALDVELLYMPHPADTVSIIPAEGDEPRLTRSATEGIQWAQDKCLPGETIRVTRDASNAVALSKKQEAEVKAASVNVAWDSRKRW